MNKLHEDAVGAASAVGTGNVDLTVSMPLGSIAKRKQSAELNAIEEEQIYSYSCCAAIFEDIFSTRITNFAKDLIKEEDVIEYERSPHVSIKYGLQETSPETVFTLLKSNLRFGCRIGVFLEEIDVFENDEQDVVVIKCRSEKLSFLNQLITENFDCVDIFPEYKPHITLAYVKKGTGAKYKGKYLLEQTNTVIEDIIFTNTEASEFSYLMWSTVL